MSSTSRIFAYFAPLVFTAVLSWAVISDAINFGAGEKDVILLFPLNIFSIAFAMVSLFMSTRNVSFSRIIRVAFSVALTAAIALSSGLIILFA